ncbi:MAG TPA: amidohydrolase family protein [Cyclobacteriaceae bacterium]|nr:amidohydrolase family protein [Cyclobacteriaceae bacterium]
MKIRKPFGFITLFLLFLNGLIACNPSNHEEEDYYTLEDYAQVDKIDVHVHINTGDQSLVEQAEKDNFILLTINVEVPDYPPIDQQLNIASGQQKAHPERVYFLSTFETETIQEPGWDERAIDYIKSSMDRGSIGIKVWKNLGMVIKNEAGDFITIDDPVFYPVFSFLEENGIPVCGHIGEPKNCWLPLEEMTVNNDRNYFKSHPQYHMYLHPEYPSYEELIAARDRMLDKFPNLKFIGTHLGSMEWSVDEIAKRLEKYPNMAVDLTARIPHLQYQSLENWQRVYDFFINYQDRIMYGTDLHITKDAAPEAVKSHAHQTWLRDWQYFVTADSMQNETVNGKFKGLRLPRDVVDKIYTQNALKWYPIDLAQP